MEEILESARSVLKLEADELLRHTKLLDQSFVKALKLISEAKGKLIVTGVGKSGHIAAKMAATFASTGTPSFFLHPTEAIHGDLGMVEKDDIVLAISYSGQSQEIVRIMPHLKRYGVKIITMTSNPKSSLAKFGETNIDINIVREACLVGAAPTVSTTLTLALGDALAVCLMKLKNFTVENFANFHPGGSLGLKLYTKVGDIMRTKELPVVSENVSLKVAIDVMTHGKLGTVLLTNSQGELVAILSDGDLRRALMSENFDIEDDAIKYATKNPKTINDQNILASKALELIEKTKIQLLVVVDDKIKPIGILHIHDLANLGLI
ncbi:MAG: KpsF/GutQ family sugar-phosphate isomerase [Campylobacter sp.]|nr:KpsF/GutQ family sugar-phosphate isomerase [Campylobacter sp.]